MTSEASIYFMSHILSVQLHYLLYLNFCMWEAQMVDKEVKLLGQSCLFFIFVIPEIESRALHMPRWLLLKHWVGDVAQW